MLKRVDVAVYESMKAGDALEGGVEVLDLANGGVGYAMDENNADLVTEAMKTPVDAAAASIASGDIVVHDYTSDDSCPALSF